MPRNVTSSRAGDAAARRRHDWTELAYSMSEDADYIAITLVSESALLGRRTFLPTLVVRRDLAAADGDGAAQPRHVATLEPRIADSMYGRMLNREGVALPPPAELLTEPEPAVSTCETLIMCARRAERRIPKLARRRR